MPFLGGVIGYVTNTLAVKMLFRPIKPKRFLFFRFQGLVGRRQNDLAASIGDVVGEHLVRHEDLVQTFQNVDLAPLIGELLERGMAPKIEELRGLPLIGGFLTPKLIDDLRASMTKGILDNKQEILDKLQVTIEEHLDIEDLVRQKVEAFPVQELERMVLRVASTELRTIELLGAVLGAIIGLLQVAIVAWTSQG